MIADAQPDPAPPAPSRASSALLAGEELEQVIEGYRTMIDLDPATEPRLRAVLEHVLGHPGSLVRAQLAFSILRAHQVEIHRALAVAVAIEYFHTASLVFDDMPCMDDASERRGVPCAHVAHGEAAATLAGLALINRGYALLWEVIASLPPAHRMEASQLVTSCLGLRGILNGQSRDLHFSSSARRERDVMDVAYGKTVTLIRLTLGLPALVAGVTSAERADLEHLSTLWGLAYQIMDDFKDCLMTPAETGKTVARDALLAHPNLPATIGHAPAQIRLSELMRQASALVSGLERKPAAWGILRRLQSVLEREQGQIGARLAVAVG